MTDSHDGDQTDNKPFYCGNCLRDIHLYDVSLIVDLDEYDEDTGEQYYEVFCSRTCRKAYEGIRLI